MEALEEQLIARAEELTEDSANFTEDEFFCEYLGTDDIEVKIWLIGVLAVGVCLLSILLNGFFTLVFLKHEFVRRTPVFYFGILAIIDTIMAINYILVIAVPVYFDYFQELTVYHIYLWYFRVMFTESNAAMFASMLLIVLATTERLLKTFHGPRIVGIRRFMENHRLLLCLVFIGIACLYKTCVYWELEVKENTECANFSRYEIVTSWLSNNKDYQFWFMFVTRNAVDRILPFCALVTMNVLIIKGLKKEYQRQSITPQSAEEVNSKTHRSTLRDATRILIAVISMYLMSQTLQVFITCWETIHRKSLEQNFPVFYSYTNDIVSILTLLSSSLRYPVYCKANRLIYIASVATIKDLRSSLCSPRKPVDYEPVPKGVQNNNTSENGRSSENHGGTEVKLLVSDDQLLKIERIESFDSIDKERSIEVEAVELPASALKAEHWKL